MLQLSASSTTGFEKEIAQGGRPNSIDSEVNVSEVKTSGPCRECKETTGQSCDCCLSWICGKHASCYSLFLIGEPAEIRYCKECSEDAIRKVEVNSAGKKDHEHITS